MAIAALAVARSASSAPSRPRAPNLGLPSAGFPAGGGFAGRSLDQFADAATRASLKDNLTEVRLRETG